MTIWTLWLTAAIAAPPSDDPGPVRDLVAVHQLQTRQTVPYAWAAQHAGWTQATVLVLEVDPAATRPTQSGTGLLFVGELPAERLSWAADANHVVYLVPGWPALDETPIHIAHGALAETIDPAAGKAALANAEVTRVFSADTTRAAAGGRPVITLEDDSAVYAWAADPVTEWSPGDADRAAGWRVSANPTDDAPGGQR